MNTKPEAVADLAARLGRENLEYKRLADEVLRDSDSENVGLVDSITEAWALDKYVILDLRKLRQVYHLLSDYRIRCGTSPAVDNTLFMIRTDYNKLVTAVSYNHINTKELHND